VRGMPSPRASHKPALLAIREFILDGEFDGGGGGGFGRLEDDTVVMDGDDTGFADDVAGPYDFAVDDGHVAVDDAGELEVFGAESDHRMWRGVGGTGVNRGSMLGWVCATAGVGTAGTGLMRELAQALDIRKGFRGGASSA